MTSYILVLHTPPWSYQSVASLKDFALAAMDLGNEIKAVFLYQDAVLAALPELDIPSDELNGQAVLMSLSQEHHVPLILCATAAEKRGVNHQHIAPEFSLAGLAEFAELSSHADKIIQFK
jgi:tRNA 2-thiouridine synthesizing protein D